MANQERPGGHGCVNRHKKVNLIGFNDLKSQTFSEWIRKDSLLNRHSTFCRTSFRTILHSALMSDEASLSLRHGPCKV